MIHEAFPKRPGHLSYLGNLTIGCGDSFFESGDSFEASSKICVQSELEKIG